MISSRPGPGVQRGAKVEGHATAIASSARRVLVIDDEPRIRSFLTRALSAAGFAVTGAATGPQGLKSALSDHPDLVLLDLELPGLSGEQVLRHLQRQRPGQTVLVWSATVDPDAERRCLTLGACGYLRKPLPIQELVSRIRANLG